MGKKTTVITFCSIVAVVCIAAGMYLTKQHSSQSNDIHVNDMKIVAVKKSSKHNDANADQRNAKNKNDKDTSKASSQSRNYDKLDKNYVEMFNDANNADKQDRRPVESGNPPTKDQAYDIKPTVLAYIKQALNEGKSMPTRDFALKYANGSEYDVGEFIGMGNLDQQLNDASLKVVPGEHPGIYQATIDIASKDDPNAHLGTIAFYYLEKNKQMQIQSFGYNDAGKKYNDELAVKRNGGQNLFIEHH